MLRDTSHTEHFNIQRKVIKLAIMKKCCLKYFKLFEVTVEAKMYIHILAILGKLAKMSL